MKLPRGSLGLLPVPYYFSWQKRWVLPSSLQVGVGCYWVFLSIPFSRLKRLSSLTVSTQLMLIRPLTPSLVPLSGSSPASARSSRTGRPLACMASIVMPRPFCSGPLLTQSGRSPHCCPGLFCHGCRACPFSLSIFGRGFGFFCQIPKCVQVPLDWSSVVPAVWACLQMPHPHLCFYQENSVRNCRTPQVKKKQYLFTGIAAQGRKHHKTHIRNNKGGHKTSRGWPMGKG